jgi:cyanophycin synthetase
VVPDPDIPVIQITGTNGKTTTTRTLAHLVMEAGRSVAYSSTDGVYRGTRRVKKGDYSGFGGAAMALAGRPDIAVLETARGGILLRGIGVLHNDVAVVTNVSADHLDLHGIHTVDQLAEVKGTITKITRPEGWDVLNADDPRVLAMRRHAAGRIWVYSLHRDHPAIRETLSEGGHATTVIDGAIAVIRGSDVEKMVNLVDVPSTLAGISSIYTSNVLAATSAALAAGLPRRSIVSGLKTFVLDQERNPGRANLYELEGRVLVIDYAHNEAGVLGLTEILRGLRLPGGETWLAICTAGDRNDQILHGFGFRAAVGTDHLAVADLPHYTRGRSTDEIFAKLSEAAADAGAQTARYPDELRALKAMFASSSPGDVVAVTALGMRPQLFRWLARQGARRLTPADVKRLVRRAPRS